MCMIVPIGLDILDPLLPPSFAVRIVDIESWLHLRAIFKDLQIILIGTKALFISDYSFAHTS